MTFNKPKITKILFATDLSQNANRAFSYAVSLAEAYNASVTVLHVLEKIPPNAELLLLSFLGYHDLDELRQKRKIDLIKQIKSRIEQICNEAAAQVPACRILLHEVIVEEGKASDRILYYAETGGYDAVVMGSRGHGLVQDTLMGGTSRKVVHFCPIPVFVIPMSNSKH